MSISDCVGTYRSILHGRFVAWLGFEQYTSLVTTTGIRIWQCTSTTKLAKERKVATGGYERRIREESELLEL